MPAGPIAFHEFRMKNKTDLKFKEQDPDEGHQASEGPDSKEEQRAGISALFGRIDSNITFHPRGAYSETKFDNAFPGAYFQILKSAFRMATMFFRKK